MKTKTKASSTGVSYLNNLGFSNPSIAYQVKSRWNNFKSKKIIPSKISYSISQLNQFTAEQFAELKSFTLDNIYRITPNREFNERNFAAHIKMTDSVAVAMEKQKNGGLKIKGAVYYSVERVLVGNENRNVIVLNCAVVDEQAESSGIASKLALLTVISCLGLHPFRRLIALFRTANPRVAAGWIHYVKSYPRIPNPIPSSIKNLANELVQYFFPESPYHPEEMRFQGCYNFAVTENFEVNFDTLKSNDEHVNHYFLRHIYTNLNGKITASGNALLLLTPINYWTISRCLFRQMITSVKKIVPKLFKIL